LHEAVIFLNQLKDLGPSIHDERLQALVHHVVSRREHLSLTALVEMSRVLHSLGFHKELGNLTVLVLESASFLPFSVVLSLAKTLAVTAHLAPPETSAEARAAVFRMLGEHVEESMFDAVPEELAEAMLAIASFYCSRRSGAPSAVLARPWHHRVLNSAGGLLAGRAAVLPPRVLVKCLRACTLLVLSSPVPAATGLVPAQQLPLLAEALAPKLAELPARPVVRSLHALASLPRRGLLLDARGWGLCAAAAAELQRRPKDLGVRDISFALQALAALADAQPPELLFIGPSLLEALYAEVQHLIPSMNLPDALMMCRACEKLAAIAAPGVLLELFAAEILREARHIEPQSLCEAVVSFGRLRFGAPAFWESMSRIFVAQLPRCTPPQVATILHTFGKRGLQAEYVYASAAPQVVQNLLGSRPRDVVLCLWAFAKAMHLDPGLFSKAQEELKLSVSKLTPADMSMVLWSIGRVECHVDEALLSGLAHRISTECRGFPLVPLLVTCLAFARLGFAQQTVLAEVYRSVYAQLPFFSDSQLAYCFFLFSTSGIRDEALLGRFLFESGQRLPRLRGQDLSNVALACSRTATRAALAQRGLAEALRQRVLEQLGHLGTAGRPAAPLLGIYLAAPRVLALSRAESLQVMTAMSAHLPGMEAPELAPCLLATARVGIVHKPLLLPLFHRIHKLRGQLRASEVVSCIWSVHLLGFCKPKLRRSLGFVFLEQVRKRRVPARMICDVLPALSHLGYWERLPLSLQRSVWRLAEEDVRQSIAEPPPPRQPPAHDGEASRPWCLPRITPGLFRRRARGRIVSRLHQLESVAADPREEQWREDREERELAEEHGPQPTGRSAVDDFVRMVRRL